MLLETAIAIKQYQYGYIIAEISQITENLVMAWEVNVILASLGID
jgi:hypothetical protein